MGKCRAVVKLLAELVSWRPRFIAGSHLSPIPLDVRYVAQISTVSWTNFINILSILFNSEPDLAAVPIHTELTVMQVMWTPIYKDGNTK